MSDHEHGQGLPDPKQALETAAMKKLARSSTERPIVEFDYTRYAEMLGDTELADDDKRALIEALWSVITGFVEMGFGVHPVQQAMEESANSSVSCGKLRDCSGTDSTDSLHSPKVLETMKGGQP